MLFAITCLQVVLFDNHFLITLMLFFPTRQSSPFVFKFVVCIYFLNPALLLQAYLHLEPLESPVSTSDSQYSSMSHSSSTSSAPNSSHSSDDNSVIAWMTVDLLCPQKQLMWWCCILCPDWILKPQWLLQDCLKWTILMRLLHFWIQEVFWVASDTVWLVDHHSLTTAANLASVNCANVVSSWKETKKNFVSLPHQC